ncbi:hypothetical protein KFE25_006430 [Diacronema lutheri]|uniref:Uncharacterized protein n=1 Tax=Diacronema lutheri TaxID=2081491 RepID=A0A8J5Y231_DIALT|nr:hypothetical protein KFE25_006430 [Diacronema lutheri]
MKLVVPHVALLRDVVRRGARACALLDATDRHGLHPLVVPLFTRAAPASPTGERERVVGLLARAPPGAEWCAVETSRAADWTANALVPLGPVRSLAHRLVAEAHHADARAAAPLVELASRAPAGERAPLFDGADPILRTLGLSKYLLMRAGAFPDVWATLVDAHLARGDATAALIAAERCTGLNKGWGCALWAQSRLAARLGRPEEARDFALAALLEPLDTLGVDVPTARRAAAVPDDISVVRYRAALAERRGAPARGAPAAREEPRTQAEIAARRAADALDDAVEAGAGWSAFDTHSLAAAYDDAGSSALGAVVRGEVTAVE